MYELRLGTATDQVTFLGETVAAPFRGGTLKQTSAGSTAARDTFIVEEIYDLVLEDSPANLNVGLASFQRILNQAANYDRRKFGLPVYLWATPVCGEPTWTSPVKCGAIDPCPVGAGGVSPASFTTGRDMGSMAIRLFIERFDYWEGALTHAPLSNRSASRATNGIGVYNHTDADPNHDNFVDILGSDLAFDLPAACQIAVEGVGVAYSFDGLVVNQNVQSNPAALNSILEAAGTADATCSSGSKQVVTVSLPVDTLLASWTLPQAMLNACAGNDFMVLLRLANVLAAGDVTVHLGLYTTSGSNCLIDLPPVLLPAGQSLIELGVLTLPPSLAGLGAGLYALTLKLKGKIAAGSRSLEIDYFHFAAMDGYRRIARTGRVWYQDEAMVDDSCLGITYLWNTDTGWVVPNFNAFGQPIFIYPNLDQRFHFLHAGAHASEIDRRTLITIDYKPRKRNL